MASQRLKLKQIAKNKKIVKSKVTELAYCRYHVAFNRVIDISDGFLVITRNEADAETIMKEEAIAMFYEHGYDVIIPPSFRAKRSIFIRRVDEMILENEEKDLIQEINAKNQWAKVQSLIKIKNNLKITFTDQAMVTKAMDTGLLCCNMSVTPDQISRETYTEIVTCFKCYKYNKHTTKECQNPTKLCSCCCSPDHHWKECTSTIKKCINCGDNHHTLAPYCPIKKKAIENKQKSAIVPTQRQTYSATTINGGNARVQPAAATTLQLQGGIDNKVVACILMSHFHNLAEPGQFSHYFSKIMAANGLPNIVVPEVTDSLKVLNALQSAGVVESTETTQAIKSTPAAKKQLFAAGSSIVPDSEDSDDAAASIAAATSVLTDVVITPLNKRPKLDIAMDRDLKKSEKKDQQKCKQERMLTQKQNDLDAQAQLIQHIRHNTPTRATNSSSSGSLKRTPLKERNMEHNGESRMQSLSALKEDEIKAMDIHYYTTSEFDGSNFVGQAPIELWNKVSKTSFLDPFKQFKHPEIQSLTEKDVRYLFSINKIPSKFVQIFDKLEEGEFRRRRAGPRSPSN